MTRRRKSNGLIGIVIFIAFVGLSGFALAATGQFSNPFGFLIQAQGRGEGRPPMGDANGGTRPVRSFNGGTGSTNTTPSGSTNVAQVPPAGEQGSGGEQASINWSQLGNVLFDLWFLCATTAVVIVAQKAGRYLIQQVKQHRQPAAAT